MNMDNTASMAQDLLHLAGSLSQHGDHKDYSDLNYVCKGRWLQFRRGDFDVQDGDGTGSAVSDTPESETESAEV